MSESPSSLRQGRESVSSKSPLLDPISLPTELNAVLGASVWQGPHINAAKQYPSIYENYVPGKILRERSRLMRQLQLDIKYLTLWRDHIQDALTQAISSLENVYHTAMPFLRAINLLLDDDERRCGRSIFGS